MVREIVCDTSAIITIFSAGHLSGNEDCYLRELGQYHLVASELVIAIKHAISEYLAYRR